MDTYLLMAAVFLLAVAVFYVRQVIELLVSIREIQRASMGQANSHLSRIAYRYPAQTGAEFVADAIQAAQQEAKANPSGRS